MFRGYREHSRRECGRIPRVQGCGLSFTDCTTLAILAEHGITKLLTFDGGFRQFSEFQVLPG